MEVEERMIDTAHVIARLRIEAEQTVFSGTFDSIRHKLTIH